LREPSPDLRDEVKAAVDATTDWSEVLGLARHHRVAGFIARAAVEYAIELPESVQRALRHFGVIQTGESLRMAAPLRRVCDRLRQSGVPTLVLKGPALARTLYPTVALRPYADLDIVVQDRDEETAISVLLSVGYRELIDAPERGRRLHRTAE